MKAPRDVPPAGTEEDDEPRRSRTDSKRERVATETALAELAERLLSATPKVMAALQLDEMTLQAIADTRRIDSAPARARALRQVRSLLRGADWLTVLRRLDALAGGIAPTALSETEAGRHAALLSAQGDPGLHRFLEQFPGGDRGRLRQLMQNVRRAPEAKREKARRQLEALIQAILNEHSASETESPASDHD
jgi:ribosome-associated protein